MKSWFKLSIFTKKKDLYIIVIIMKQKVEKALKKNLKQ